MGGNTGAERVDTVIIGGGQAGLASGLDPRIVQLHSSEYRAPSQLREGGVLVVGAGNSGAEIARELARTRPTLLAGKPVGEIPVRHGSRAARLVLPVIRFIG